MENRVNALPAEGAAESAQTTLYTKRIYDVTARDRRFLLGTAAFCVLLAHTFFWCGPCAGMTAAVFAWYVLVLAYVGMEPMAVLSNRVLLAGNLFLAATLALGSNWLFRWWNGLALLALLPLHAIALSGAGRLPWWRPAMLWERLCLLMLGLFGNLGAGPAALSAGRQPRDGRRAWALAFGLCGALVLVCGLLPVLASADALFAAATEALRNGMRIHLSATLRQVLLGLILTPFCFSFLYALRRPTPLKAVWKDRVPAIEALTFVLMLGALDALYLLFLGVQSAGLFGGPEYLAVRGISYAEWARSGFFQMVGVTVLNLTVMLAALTLTKRAGALWRTLRVLAGLLTLESLVLLGSAAWRMTLYVSAYGLSFKRCMTYWGMGMMALLFLTALWKTVRPDFSFCRWAFPLALAGWVVINCVPVDYLVAKDQVDRYLNHESPTLSVHYLAYSLSYDTLSQLDRLDPEKHLTALEGTWWGQENTAGQLLERRRQAAREDCGDWRTWSLSACLAAGGISAN